MSDSDGLTLQSSAEFQASALEDSGPAWVDGCVRFSDETQAQCRCAVNEPPSQGITFINWNHVNCATSLFSDTVGESNCWKPDVWGTWEETAGDVTLCGRER